MTSEPNDKAHQGIGGPETNGEVHNDEECWWEDEPPSANDNDPDGVREDDEESPWVKFPLVSSKVLAGEIKPASWLIDGVWIEKSAGVLAGKKKTFKTWQLHAMGLSVTSKLAFLDEFVVFTSGPVLYLSGEGGRDEFMSRHQAIARRYGIKPKELSDLPFHALFKLSTLDDDEFLGALRHHLDKVQPVAVYIDPLYAYHPKDVDISAVYSRGPMLARIREEIEPYAALIIGDHINKSADDKSLDLDDIGYSGMSQWADSWSLQRHREKFQSVGVDNYAKLEVEFGSRRTGSMRYDVDWHLVRDMSDRRVIKWDSCDWAVVPRGQCGVKIRLVTNDDDCFRAIQVDVEAHPDTTKTNTVTRLISMYQGRTRDEWRALWDKALRDGYIISVKIDETKPYKNTTRKGSVERFKRGRVVDGRSQP